MGQAKQRLERELKKQHFCIFCGGSTPAVSIDHCPPKSIFDGFRPKGLEFPQCYDCQQGTRQIDLIVGMLSRIYPDPTTDEGKAASRKAIRGFINNHPDLARLFVSGEEQPIEYRGGAAYPIQLGGNDRLHRAVLAFGARLGAGLYYELVRKPVPINWPIVVRWQSNHMLDQDVHLDELLRSFGAPRTLVMGKLAVPHEFRYWSGVAADAPDHFLAFAAFREALGITMVVTPPENLQDGIWGPPLFYPGFLKGFRP